MSTYDILMSFFTYAFLGWCTEVAFAAAKQRQFVNRGFLNGPVCPIYGVGVTVVIALLVQFSDHIVFLYITSTILVTFLEWLTGLVLEKLFHHRWWDYSQMPLNIGGYVCLLFSLIWGVVCVAIVKLVHPLLYDLMMFVPHWLGVSLLVVFSALLLADIYVTASGILKWNKRLEKLDELAKELHNISDQIGENIYENMMTGLELQEKGQVRVAELKEKGGAKAAELKELKDEKTTEFKELREAKVAEFKEIKESKAAALKGISEARAAELRRIGEEKAEEFARAMNTQHKTGKRILKAFPKLQSREHKELVLQLRKRLKNKTKEKH